MRTGHGAEIGSAGRQIELAWSASEIAPTAMVGTPTSLRILSEKGV